MFKNQKSKILVFLLMLGILYGCKRQILDPLNPKTHLPAKAQFDKVKGFYENGRYKNQPKRTSSSGNERMTAADSARFKDFEPKWDETVVELLPNNEKMLIVPVVRNLQVNYNQDIGFIRRLCIRVDANEDFLEANIVELVGNLTFVKENHNTIFKNYKENNISGFSGVMATYEIDYNNVTTKNFDNGISTTCNNCLVSGVDPCTYSSNGYIEIIYCYYGDGGVSTPPLPPPPPPQGNPYPIINYPVTNNPNTGNNPSHGGGGIGSTGGNNNNGNGISDGPPPLVFLPVPFVRADDGVSWEDIVWDEDGYPIEPDDENEINISSGITEDSSLFLPENADIKAIYDAIKTQPEWTNYIKYFNANDPANSSLTIKIGDMPVGHEKSSAVTVPSSPTNSATIIINKNNIRQLRPTNIALVILHEGIHAKLFSLLKRLAKNLLLTTTEKVDVNNLRRMIRLYGSKHGEHT